MFRSILICFMNILPDKGLFNPSMLHNFNDILQKYFIEISQSEHYFQISLRYFVKPFLISKLFQKYHRSRQQFLEDLFKY